MQNKLSNLSVKSEVKLNIELEKVWDLLSKPSHLELFHPFCKSHKIIIWNGQKKNRSTHLFKWTIVRKKYLQLAKK